MDFLASAELDGQSVSAHDQSGRVSTQDQSEQVSEEVPSEPEYMDDEDSTSLTQCQDEEVIMQVDKLSNALSTQPQQNLHEDSPNPSMPSNPVMQHRSWMPTTFVEQGDQIESSGAITKFIDSRIIIYSNDNMQWNFEKHNFNMTFQSESLPTDTANTEVEISVTSGEGYVLPKETQPVSMFFSIKCQHKFQKNVLVSIEHFSAETSDLSFVVSSNLQPPFHFELLSGGTFMGIYGLITRTEFSILGIVTRIRTGRWPEMVYYFALYTSPPVDYKWTVFIYVMKDSATNRYRIKEDTNDSERTYNSHAVATVNHTIDYFTLDVSLRDEEISHGWQLPLESINPIKISRRRIDGSYGVPTPANFKIILDVTKFTMSDFLHCYKIAEVDQENSLTLALTAPQTSPVRQKRVSAIETFGIINLEELQRQRSKLVTGFKFEMNWVASELVAQGILSTQHQNDIANTRSTLNPNERADIMVSAIMDKLELDSNNLRLVLKVLRKKPILYKETIALLEDVKLWKRR